MHIAEVVTIAKSLPLLRLNTYKSLILSYSADYRRIFKKKLQQLESGSMVKQSLDSINKVRNNVAHGIDISMSFSEIVEHFERALKILECLDSVLH